MITRGWIADKIKAYEAEAETLRARLNAVTGAKFALEELLAEWDTPAVPLESILPDNVQVIPE